MFTCPNPAIKAVSTSGEPPWLNQSVSRRKISCSDPPLAFMDEPAKEIDRKNPLIAGATCCIASFVDAPPWRWKCSMAVALNNAQ